MQNKFGVFLRGALVIGYCVAIMVVGSVVLFKVSTWMDELDAQIYHDLDLIEFFGGQR